MTNKLTHLDEQGKAHMVDVSEKQSTRREAVARGCIVMKPETLAMIRDGLAQKGDVLGTARLAGILAAKRTSELIPLCHNVPLTDVQVTFALCESGHCVNIQGTARCVGQTGVEIEALTAVSTAALTIYDMCKAVDRGMVVQDIRLVKKSGGASGTWALSENEDMMGSTYE